MGPPNISMQIIHRVQDLSPSPHQAQFSCKIPFMCQPLGVLPEAGGVNRSLWCRTLPSLLSPYGPFCFLSFYTLLQNSPPPSSNNNQQFYQELGERRGVYTRYITTPPSSKKSRPVAGCGSLSPPAKEVFEPFGRFNID